MEYGMSHLVFDAFLIALFVFQEVRNYIERKNIMDRFMSRDFPEYSAYQDEASYSEKSGRRNDSIDL